MNSFSALELLPSLKAVLSSNGITKPTEIQSRTLPLLLARKSAVGVAETGSGKTLAYVLPMLHVLKTLEVAGQLVKENGRPRGAVVVPTRELGEQVSKVFKTFTHTTRLRVRTALGGTTSEVAKKNITGRFEILIATPGRLIKFLDRGLLNLSDIHMLVFDEAGQMLDEGFLPDAKKIVEQSPEGLQLALFSATVSTQVQELIKALFTGVEVVRSEGSHRLVPTLKTNNLKVIDGKRLPILEKLLVSPYVGGTLLFTNTREQCDALAELLEKLGRKSAIYRGEMVKTERRANLKAFRKGEIDFLVSTDLGSRGLDLEHVKRVINYHLPQEMENYLHRVGRTARAGRSGLVVNFVTERDQPLMNKLDLVQSKPKK
jgi:ATP-dependent RNA helicase RhlE